MIRVNMLGYRTIMLTQDQSAKVSRKDWIEFIKYLWYSKWQENTQSFYAARKSQQVQYKRTTIYMHNETSAVSGESKYKDHISHDTLDNLPSNLRLASAAQNQYNRRISKNNTSGYKGAGWSKPLSKWRASIQVDRKNIHLGYFNTIIEAAQAYDTAAIKYFGMYACLNFPSKEKHFV